MKLHGITGTGSGKLGSSVFSVTAGEQVVRQYQPVVTNPSTENQVNNRARLKLLSQLSAVMADVIAIPRAGALSPRNIFVSDNYPITTAENGAATIDLAKIALTKGGMQIPAVVAERDGDTAINVALAAKADQLVARVIYIAFYRNNVGELQLLDSAVVETAGAEGTFPYVFPYMSQDIIVYAYGIFDKNSKATAKFGNYGVETGTQVASLIADRKVSESDYLITKTQGVVLAGETTADFVSVRANNVAIANTGSTSIPYSTSALVELTVDDALGMYARLVVDGVGGVPTLIEVPAFVLNTSHLAGGENIRVQLGTLNGSTFLPAKTFGGIIAVSAQTSAFSAVDINGTAIAAAGNTQVAQQLNSAIHVSATGVSDKYLRVSVNGVAQSPVAFSNGSATAGLLTPAIGDNITFQIGRMVNGTFVEDVIYGGTAVIAEVPAIFTSVAVNGTTIAASGSTNVAAQASNSVIVNSQNASGKYLAVLNGNNEVVSVHAISGNTTTITTSNVAGDTIKFAIGTGSSTSSFVAQTNFGGTCVFIEAPSTHITNLVVGGQSVNDDLNLNSGTYEFSGNTDLTGLANRDLIILSSPTKPNTSETISSVWYSHRVSDGAFSGQVSVASNVRLWFCIGKFDAESESGNITYVYDYSVSGPTEN
ncbi:MAG: hypothetical protein IKM77_09560 [Prevotella sp.]|nr:hypothetical protein [Prevotella sp.]